MADPSGRPHSFSKCAVSSRPRMSHRQYFDRHACQARLGHVQLLGRSIRQIDHPSLHEFGSICYPDSYGFVISQVHHPHLSSKWQRRMARGHLVHAEHLPACRLPAVEFIAVPGRDPLQKLKPGLLRCRSHHLRGRTRNPVWGSSCGPWHSSIRLHCPGWQRTQHPGHCHARNPRKKPQRYRLFGAHVGCFWSFEHPMILSAVPANILHKNQRDAGKNEAKTARITVLRRKPLN